MYTGPHWEGGIKPEKSKPAAPPAAKTEAKADIQPSATGNPVASTEAKIPPPAKTDDSAPQQNPAS
jgi:hypothetical protein